MAERSFKDFFKHLHGYEPFPWQERLANDVSANGEYPDILNLPTASGKTAFIDIWLWALYLDMEERGRKERKTPMRLFYVVDRRIVADAANERAEHIKDKLKCAQNGVLKKVADILRPEKNYLPLETAILRGGMERDWDWCKSPAQPLACSGTVDMIGSRLLFRGYGVSPGQRPIGAALVGCDSMVVLDEAHLSSAFERTLKNIVELRGEENDIRKLVVVRMSATHREGDGKSFELDEQDYKNNEIKKRIEEEKTIRLAEAGKLESKLAKEAQELSENSKSPPVVGVIANTVDTARKVYEKLKKEKNSEAILLIGRSRPYDRDNLIKQHGDRLFAGKKQKGETPLFVVATQCVEAGADFDFDKMTTEIAPLDSLLQRFGRLNRLGNSSEAEGVIVATNTARKKQLPFYGDAPEETWKWLSEIVEKNSKKETDFSASAMSGIMKNNNGKELGKCFSPPSNDSPQVMREYIDIWSRTSIPQFAEPDIPLFLHGEEPARADVQFVWRADIPENPEEKEKTLIQVSEVLSALPPRAEEALSVPLWKAKQWLSGEEIPADVADVEGAGIETEKKGPPENEKNKVIRWRGRERDQKDRAALIKVSEVSPGDVVVLSSSQGGCDKFGWNPSSKEEVKDIAWETRNKNNRKYAMRVRPGCCDGNKEWEDVKNLIGEGEDLPDARKIAGELFGIKNPESCRIVRYGEKWREEGFSLIIVKRKSRSGKTGIVGLKDHCENVATEAKNSAEKAGLPEKLVESLETAGKWHDAGKAEKRWQEYATGGGAHNGQVAKSPAALSRKEWRKAGLSKGERHEYWSYLLAKNILPETGERDLILHLVASHHGNARPLPMPPDDGGEMARKAEEQEIQYNGANAQVAHSVWSPGNEFPSRFAELNKQYGWWELAYLEAILRLADYEQSRIEETK